MADLGLTIRVENLDRVRDTLNKLSGKQAREAYAKAINDAAYKVRREMQAELRNNFDRVTPFISKAPKVFEATADKLSASIAPTLDTRNRPSTGGKVGVDPQHVLQAQEFGGPRRDKRSEVVLRRARILPAGMQVMIPADRYGGPFPGSEDGRGNLRASFLVRLLSYLQAFGEQGFRSNITDKSALRRKDITDYSSMATGRQVRLMDGWEFFVSNGTKSTKFGRESRRGGRTQIFERDRRQNLRAGVWARQGKTIKAVLIFAPAGKYTPRISMERIAQAADVQNYLDRRVRFRIREAAGV